ncbi:NAD-binding protein [Streptomyces sp. T12]|uniref:NAD-binding protein n=1 Tax=Streptomyces sp. T12 TaxID=477697 RepID=UPI0021BD19BC|nr:NAD-binding protein [Streptomyces sp. T12]
MRVPAGMRVVVVGAGQVGHTVVKSLAEAHGCTVIDSDRTRLDARSHTYDVRTEHGSGTRRETLVDAGVAGADLVLACTSRDEVNFGFTRRELEQAVHPDAVLPVRVSGRVVGTAVLRSVLLFVLLYLLALALGTLGLALDAGADAGGTRAFTALGAAAACLGNVGPAFGELGPFGSYAPLGQASKVLLTVLMLLGRIEIVPLAVLLRAATGARRRHGPPGGVRAADVPGRDHAKIPRRLRGTAVTGPACLAEGTHAASSSKSGCCGAIWTAFRPVGGGGGR